MTRRTLTLAFMKASVLLWAVSTGQAATVEQASGPWTVPRDAVMAAGRSDEFAWRLFVALNWPADRVARAADPSAPFGADRPAVWETWQDANEVYLDDGADPGPWKTEQPGVAMPAARRFESVSPKDFANLKHIVAWTMVPLSEPLVNADRLTEIRMNRSVYEYIRATGLYCLDQQVKFYQQRRPVSFPSGAQQVKAKWRRIGEQERSRYHTVEVTFADGTTKLYGLIALHIASKDLPTWFWATFEHVDNAKAAAGETVADSERVAGGEATAGGGTAASGEGWQLPSHDTFACGDEPADCNRAPRGMGLEGTVWQNYRLRGTLTRFVDSQGQPRLLGNSALETGMQSSASCMTCHARSAIGIKGGAPLRLPILASGNADARDMAQRRGFVGLPRDEWFRISDDGKVLAPLLPLDFVWSLSKAKPRPPGS